MSWVKRRDKGHIQGVSGKIVLIAWLYDDPFSRDFTQVAKAWAYCRIIESVIQQSFMRKPPFLELALSVSVIALGVILMRKGSLGFAITITLSLGIALFAFSIIALRSLRLVIDAGYPLRASLLCAVILPLVRLGHESRRS